MGLWGIGGRVGCGGGLGDGGFGFCGGEGWAAVGSGSGQDGETNVVEQGQVMVVDNGDLVEPVGVEERLGNLASRKEKGGGN